MRIGLVTPSWPGSETANGIATAVAHLAAGLEEAGHGVTIVPLQPAGESDPVVVNLPLPRPWTVLEKLSARLGRGDGVLARITAERIARAAMRAIADRGIEVLVMEETQGWAGLVQRQIAIPVVATLHGPWFLHRPFHGPGRDTAAGRTREAREGASLEHCAGITAPSRDVLERTRSRYGLAGIPQAVIRNPIPPQDPVDYDALDETARRCLLFVGRFDRHKGGDVVLEGFAELIRQGVEARLTFVGPDPGIVRSDGTRQQIGEALAALPENVRARIDYKGPLGKTEIADLRRCHGIAVIASRYENLNYTMLESLAAGVATICTAVGGQREVIRDGEIGLLVPPEDPIALAASCRRLLDEPSLAARLGAAAHAEIRRRFAPLRIAGDMAAFLEKAPRQ